MRDCVKIGLAILGTMTILTTIWLSVLPSSPFEAHNYVKDNECYYGSHFVIRQYSSEADAIGYSPIDYHYLTLNVTDEDFDAEINNKYLRCGCLMNDVGPISLIEQDNPYVLQIADFIKNVCISNNPYSITKCVQSFVGDNIRYDTDSNLYGTYEYWATPTETIRVRAGDCEDRSILACSILLAIGYECALISFPQHIAPAVYLDNSLYIMDFDVPYCLDKIENHKESMKIYNVRDIDISASELIGTYIYTIKERLG